MFNRLDETLGTGQCQQLPNIPQVLRSASVELEQHEIARLHHGDVRGTDDRSVDGALLPCCPADDHIDGPFAGGLDSDDAGKRIVDVAPIDGDGHAAAAKTVPRHVVQTPPIDDEDIDVERRPRDARRSQGRRADQRMWNPAG